MPTLTRVLIALCVGVAVILAWRSYGDAAREMIASSSRELRWLAPQAAPSAQSAPDVIGQAAQAASSPDQQRLNAISLDLEAMRQNVDRIAMTQEQITRSVNQLTAGQERIARNVDQLAAGQERVTREIAKLQAVEQQMLHKNSESPPRPAPALARNPAPRSPQAPTMR
jgi:septal ring factor EnvC (AmiA/AmiB activator)